MMNNPYDLHSWSKHYREDAMAEASKRHLAERAVTDRKPGRVRQVGLGWATGLASLLRRARLAA